MSFLNLSMTFSLYRCPLVKFSQFRGCPESRLMRLDGAWTLAGLSMRVAENHHAGAAPPLSIREFRKWPLQLGRRPPTYNRHSDATAWCGWDLELSSQSWDSETNGRDGDHRSP